MDKIKDFFKKKKVDAKFKMAGEGHSLVSPPSTSPAKKAGQKVAIFWCISCSAHSQLLLFSLTKSVLFLARSSTITRSKIKGNSTDCSSSSFTTFGSECKQANRFPFEPGHQITGIKRCILFFAFIDFICNFCPYLG